MRVSFLKYLKFFFHFPKYFLIDLLRTVFRGPINFPARMYHVATGLLLGFALKQEVSETTDSIVALECLEFRQTVRTSRCRYSEFLLTVIALFRAHPMAWLPPA